jgi:hypothetical protein
MKTQLLKLPSRQDFLVYQRVRIAGASAADIRAKLRLTRVQVAQAMTRVDEFLLSQVPLKNATHAERQRAISQLVFY